MGKIKKKQLGLSFIGLCMTLGALAVVVLFVLSAFPLYNEYFKVKSVINSVSKLSPNQVAHNKEIYSSFLKNARINGLGKRLNYETIEEIVTIEKDRRNKKKLVSVQFKASSHLFKNLYLMMDFDEKIELNY